MLSSYFVAALLASAAVAGPIAPRAGKKHVSFTKNVNKDHITKLVANDKARALNIVNRHKAAKLGKRQEDVSATNSAVSYLAAVEIGSNAQQFNLIIDTGSSNTWVGAQNKLKKSKTTQVTGQTVSVSYGSGSFSGVQINDQIALSNDLVVTQSMGVAQQSTGFQGVDGIIGIGPTDLTSGTVSGANEVPTIMDTLKSSGLIQQEVIGVSFEPATEADELNGTLTFGGVDDSKFTGNITFVPVTTTAPASEFWGIDQSVEYGGQTLLTSSGIVDTGTTLLLLASDAFATYQNATGATLDQTTGLLTVTQDQFNQMSDLNFVIGGNTFALSPNGQLFPRSLNAAIGGSADQLFLVVSDLGTPSGQGLDFINGQSFLERFYSVFDTDNNQVGIANTPFTNATTN